jgi:hypothetical protein
MLSGIAPLAERPRPCGPRDAGVLGHHEDGGVAGVYPEIPLERQAETLGGEVSARSVAGNDRRPT